MFCDIALARRIDAVEARLVSAIVDHVAQSAPGLGAWREDVAGGTALFAGAGNPINKVIGVGFEAPPSPADLDHLETRFHGAGAPVRIEMSTLARAESHAALSSRGYHLLGFENVLAKPIEPTAEPSAGPGIDVRLVDAAMLEPWLCAVVEGFAVPDESGAGGDEPLPPADELLGLFRHVFTAPGHQRYVARLDGAIAGGAIAWFDGDIAFLGGAATVPASRRRGVQRALFEARLRDARQAGCSLAVLGTQPGTTSQRNAQAKGFSLLYARAVWNCAIPAPGPRP